MPGCCNERGHELAEVVLLDTDSVYLSESESESTIMHGDRMFSLR